ncbi:hypothetical protein [Kamptonema formosum]|uniref:hypothetical protein n=1 Tax=Kamptonema formosum TaxID=331992 RepID=UPI0012DF1B65|nr:hypothetical protein [Oscillatoria sp. PCC 10802]
MHTAIKLSGEPPYQSSLCQPAQRVRSPGTHPTSAGNTCNKSLQPVRRASFCSPDF